MPFFPLFAVLCIVLFWAVLFWAVAAFLFRGENLSAFDRQHDGRFGVDRAPSPEHKTVVASLGGVKALLKAVPRTQQTKVLRNYMDNIFADRVLDATFTDVVCNGVPCQWVLAPGADPSRRLLYIHGGAYIMGSPKSHRTLTSALSRLNGAAVLAVDYRLMPEHRRMAGIEDCRNAYRWILDNGPQGPGAASAVFVAGDSAGGNLTLSLIAWVRDAALRAPDAAVALSPATDGTLSSPSLRSNIATDPMLGPLFGMLAKVPAPMLLWGGALQTRINPRNPVVSPVYGDLSGLPKVLVQASDVEMLRDDARRYVHRAQAAGSPVTLQTWNHMVHVWQIFNPELPEAQEALEEIGKFLDAAAPRATA